MPPSELTLLMYARKVSTRAAYSTAAGPGAKTASSPRTPTQARPRSVPAIGLLLRLGMRFGAEPGEFGLRQPGLVCGVHGLYQVAVALVHEAALHLPRRRQRILLVLGIQLLRQEPELLHLLHLRQVPVGLVHLPRDEVQHPGLAHEACEVGMDQPVGPPRLPQALAAGPHAHAVDGPRGPHTPRARDPGTLAGDDPAGLRRAVQVDQV